MEKMYCKKQLVFANISTEKSFQENGETVYS